MKILANILTGIAVVAVSVFWAVVLIWGTPSQLSAENDLDSTAEVCE